ncbi:hypothetical protein [Desulfuromonas sp. CSMB_57]|uniref:hypothetical protein n=1 Tax=Desulfuromonas sp. CSMB_57 TaxID=2807629 RepID=UPI001CD51567|nr:hypothetical protein [Desulfuromonas sp. CSMB_57]
MWCLLRKICWCSALFGVLTGALTGFLTGTVWAEEYRAPRAGEAYVTELFGTPARAPERNRRSVTALNLGVQWLPQAPKDYEVLPFGALYLWRNPEDGHSRLRAVLAGLYNELRYDVRPTWLAPTDLILTLDNLTVPTARQEFIDGARIDEEELEWHRVHLGIGLGWRTPLAPGHQDNVLEAALSYQPGLLWFRRGSDTAADFRPPRDTYEGRVHLRLRADALERNLLELPHGGWAAGFDGWYGHRARWRDWGGDTLGGRQGGAGQRTWAAARVHALAALPVPGLADDRHRLVASFYGGLGTDLDRFSAFRLGGEPAGGETEALARPNVLGALFDEFYSRGYAIANLEYRRELLFFCFLHLRGQWAVLDRFRLRGGAVSRQTDSLPALAVALTSGAPWNSQIELGYSYNFGLLRRRGENAEFGASALSLSWSKEF